MQDVNITTLRTIQEVLNERLTLEEIKGVIYSAFSHSDFVNYDNLNDPVSLLYYIDWVHFIKEKESGVELKTEKL